MPTDPSQQGQDHRGCGFSSMLTFGVIAAVLVGLYVLSLGTLGPILLVIGALFGVIALQYVVWGWWLGRMIHEEADDDETSDGGPAS